MTRLQRLNEWFRRANERPVMRFLNRPIVRRANWIAIAVIWVGVIAGCTIRSEPTTIDPAETPAGWEILDSPHGYGNVATYCFGQFRVFVGEDDVKASSSLAVFADPTCEVVS